MKTVSIFKAQPINPDRTVESARLLMEVDLPDSPNLTASKIMFTRQAKIIIDLLISTLPGGTVDALLIELLDRKASLLVVPHVLPEDGNKSYG